jgi:hypothetical protein
MDENLVCAEICVYTDSNPHRKFVDYNTEQNNEGRLLLNHIYCSKAYFTQINQIILCNFVRRPKNHNKM